MKVLDDFNDPARVGRAHKGHGQGGQGLEQGDQPFLGSGVLQRVARVLGEEVDDVGRVGGALAGVVVVEDGISDTGRVED